MSLILGANNVADLYLGTTGAVAAYLGNDLVWSKVQPEINYIFREMDANGNLTVATGALEDASQITAIGDYGLQMAFYGCTGLTGSVSFPELTSINDRGLYYAFYGCTGLTGSVSFPELTSIGYYGLYFAFYNCTGLTGSVSFPELTSIGSNGLLMAFYNCPSLTGSVSFPKLTSIGDSGLYRVFYGCTGITEVHFKSSLSGNSQCTARNMGCTNATVYFDL